MWQNMWCVCLYLCATCVYVCMCTKCAIKIIHVTLVWYNIIESALIYMYYWSLGYNLVHWCVCLCTFVYVRLRVGGYLASS